MVLVVSARAAVDEKVSALDLGAADFVSKAFDTDEPLAASASRSVTMYIQPLRSGSYVEATSP